MLSFFGSDHTKFVLYQKKYCPEKCRVTRGWWLLDTPVNGHGVGEG